MKCENLGYYSKLEIYFLLIKNGFDYNLLELNESNIFSKNDSIGYYNHKPSYFTQKFLRTLQKYFSNKIILRMLQEYDFNLNNWNIEHSVSTLYQIDNDEILSKKLKRKNIKCFKFLHKHLVRLAIYLKKEDFNLNQKKQVITLHNKKIQCEKGEIKILVPRTKFDLIECSNAFDFCIGTEDSYGYNIRQGEYSFISVFLNNKPLQGILFNNDRIIEAFNIGNNSCDFDIKHIIRKEIFNSKKIKADSSWIDYFLYEKGTLTLVTKTESKYQYCVPENIVNELENSHSRGSYYTSFIKGNYPTIK